MQQLVVTAPGQVEWREVARPALTDPRAALVTPIAVATCDFDHLIVGGLTPFELPIAIGHECVAVVTEVGADVETVRPGDRVIVPFQISCGRCDACRRGSTTSCTEVPWLSGYGLGSAGGDWGGVVSDVVAVPYADAMLVPLPDSISPVTAAALSCNLVDAYRCVSGLIDRPGSPVLIVGGAFANIERYAVILARALGASHVDVCDHDHDRAAAAEALGARRVDKPAEAAYPITVDTSMDPELLTTAIRATAPSGTCTVSTMYAGDAGDTGDAVALPLFAMFQNAVTLTTGQPNARALIEPVLALLADSALDPLAGIDDVVDWTEAPVAFTRGTGKTVCVRPEPIDAQVPVT
jgi:threonine dehydrogenase-like Zn-dependent dehydrogenase